MKHYNELKTQWGETNKQLSALEEICTLFAANNQALLTWSNTLKVKIAKINSLFNLDKPEEYISSIQELIRNLNWDVAQIINKIKNEASGYTDIEDRTPLTDTMEKITRLCQAAITDTIDTSPDSKDSTLGPWIQQNLLYTNNILAETIGQILSQIKLSAKTPISVFISYAWSSKSRPEEKWTQIFIIQLQNHLKDAGIIAHLDWSNSRYGHNSNSYMDEIPHFHFVILIGTNSLLDKHKLGISSVCSELNVIRRKRKIDADQHKYRVIPIILSGNFEHSLPGEYERYTVIESFTNQGYTTILKELLRKLLNYGNDHTTYNNLWKNFEASHPELFIPLEANTLKAHLAEPTNKRYLQYIQDAEVPASITAITPRTRWRFFSQPTILQTSTVETVGPEIYSYQPVIWRLPKHYDYFVGREAYIKQIAHNLENSSSCAVVSTTKVQDVKGLGGIGKTQLVLEYAHRMSNLYQIIWWFDAEKDLDSQYSALADEMNNIFATEPKIIKNQKNAAEISEQVKARLRSTANWLLIFDNVQSNQSIHSSIPDSLPNTRGHVLITSRTGGWIHSLELGLMLENDADQMIALLLKRPHNTDDRKKLIDTISCYPLALVQAIAYLNHTEIKSIDNYIILYKEMHAGLQKHEASLPNSYPAIFSDYKKTVNATLNISLKAIKETYPVAELSIDLLGIISLLHTNQIPVVLLKEWAATKKIDLNFDFDEALSALSRYLFIKFDDVKSFFNIHDVVHAYAFDLLLEKQNEDEIKLLIETLLKCFITSISSINKDNSMASLGLLKSHADALYRHAERYNITSIAYAQFLSRFADLNNDLGLWNTAVDLTKKCIAIYQAHHSNNPGNAELAENVGVQITRLGHSYRTVGKNIEAKSAYNDAYQFLCKELGRDSNHIEISSPLNGLALIHMGDNNLNEAEKSLVEALEIREHQKYDYIATSYLNLGVLYTRKKDKVKSLESLNNSKLYFEKEAASKGMMNRSMAKVLRYLGNYHREFTDRQQALLYLNQSLAMYQSFGLNDTHPDIAALYIDFGHIYRDNNEKAKASDYYYKAANIYKTIFDSKHKEMTDLHEFMNSCITTPEPDTLSGSQTNRRII